MFFSNSTAGNAIITNNGTGGVLFFSNSTAGNAIITNNGAGTFDFSSTSGPADDNRITAGSIAGGGLFFLGANQLTVGGNNLSTTVSGVIADCSATCTAIDDESPSTGGSLVKIGTGTMILSGANTYTGGTTISGGVLQLGDGGVTGSILGNVINNATLAFNRSNAYQFDGVISGTGVLNQIGAGVTTLTANNTYTGATTVAAGGLIVNGSIASSSSLTVNQGAFVGGTGTLPSTVISGNLAPGNSIGTVTISGNLTFNAGSTYQVEVSPAAADRTNVTGTRVACRHRAGDPACRQLPRPDLHHPQCRRRHQRDVRQPDRHRHVRAGRAQSSSDLRRQQRLPGARSERADAAVVRQCERSTSARWRMPSTPRWLRAQRRRPRSTCCSTSAARRR